MIVNAQAVCLPFADATADAALTSPPYWGALRRYAGAQERDWPAIAYPPMPGLPPVDIPAQRVALGHEPDPFAFVAHLLQVFREVWRVLRPHGVLACNLGDCYSGSSQTGGGAASSTLMAGDGQTEESREALRETQHARWQVASASRQTGLPSKNLLLMPWRFALAMQGDGWILRSRMPGGVEDKMGSGIEPDILWKKASCMPESVRDRPTVDFEDVLIFSQDPRYFWDQQAGRVASTGRDHGRRNPPAVGTKTDDIGTTNNAGPGSTLGMNHLWATAGRNMRSVWTINPEPTDEEHFAAWPTALAARLIRVMTSERGVCPECGAPWVREVERTRFDRTNDRLYVAGHTNPGGTVPGSNARGMPDGNPMTTGWRASCTHNADPVPATVLDPFAGLGRTWEAARETGRRFIGTDLGFDYCRLALSRNDLRAMERRRIAKPKVEDWGALFRDPATW